MAFAMETKLWEVFLFLFFRLFFSDLLGWRFPRGAGSEPWSRELSGFTAGPEVGHTLRLQAEPALSQEVLLTSQAFLSHGYSEGPTLPAPPLPPSTCLMPAGGSASS